MKFCEKCGKEIMDEAVVCPNCGCKVSAAPQDNYDKIVRSAGGFFAIGTIAMVIGAFAGLFINCWLGMVLLLIAEIILLIPNTKITNEVKRLNPNLTDKKDLKSETKRIANKLASKIPTLKLSKIFAVISLILLIVFALLSNAMGI